MADYAVILGDLPEDLIQKVFLSLCAMLKARVLGLCFQRSRDASYPLLKRTYFLQRFLRLFDLLINSDYSCLEEVFDAFKERWGLVSLLHELGLPETSWEHKGTKEILELVKDTLREFSDETKGLFGVIPAAPPVAREETKSTDIPIKTLKDRITDAKNNPSIPAQVIEVIEKNKLNAIGHSGSKYAELIETLLAVPWGAGCPIEVSPQSFEEGLNNTHYGLEKPKEILLDFYSSLIWRFQRFGFKATEHGGRSGSAFLFVGPPGVGKTSLAISIAKNLGIPYHKLSLGGMRDEADLRGHGFTYEGSKPGAIVQGIIKMGCMNGMFIMDEADKTEKFAIATLLEILDPEQNHLFHDKYTQSTVDIDLSNCHFILTANTLETVPPPVVNRCEVVVLDRYSVEEKIAIAQTHLIERVRERYQISERQVFLAPEHETGLLRFLIKSFTHEAGVRELERVIRTLFMRILRKEVLGKKNPSVRITREKILEHLDPPRSSRRINEEDRVGEAMALGINAELGVGSVIPVQATPIQLTGNGEAAQGYVSMIHATGNIEKVMDESRRVAFTAILHCAEQLGIHRHRGDAPIHLHFMGGSTPKDGPSAGGAIALALASVLSGSEIRRDVAMTGEVDTQGRITIIGGLNVKLETAYDAGCRTMIIPTENLYGEGGIERMSEALKRELQVLRYDAWKAKDERFDYTRHLMQIVGVDHILQAAEIAFIDDAEMKYLESCLIPHARSVAQALNAGALSERAHPCVVYVKDAEELALDGADDSFWDHLGCYFLVRRPAQEAVVSNYPVADKQKRIRPFEPGVDAVPAILREIAAASRRGQTNQVKVSLVAPFFFIQRERANLQELLRESPWMELRLFSNNYTRQEVKIRNCKSVLNRVNSYLSFLDPGQLDSCPFLATREGVSVIDMSFIPEKYRLDLTRAQAIISKSLTTWLMTMKGSAEKDETYEEAARSRSPRVS